MANLWMLTIYVNQSSPYWLTKKVGLAARDPTCAGGVPQSVITHQLVAEYGFIRQIH